MSSSSCKDDHTGPEIDPNRMGSIELKFDNIAGNSDFSFNAPYTNANGETFKVDKLLYYISNITLKTEDGREHVVPQEQSYFLVNEADHHSQHISLDGIPEGNYSEVTFTVGVDSLRNTMDPDKRTGVLDVGKMEEKMYWSWNSGYIFVKMEGSSEAAPVGPDGNQRFRYHIGGFGGYNSPTINNVREVSLSLGRDRAQVRESKKPSIHLLVDILKMFNGNPNISIATHSAVMFSPFSVNISNNYVRMFEYDHVHNHSN